MRFITTDERIIFGIDKLQGFFIQIYNEEREMVLAMQEQCSTSLTPFSVPNLIENVTLNQLKEIFEEICKLPLSYRFSDYFRERFLLSREIIEVLMQDVSELDNDALLHAYSFIAPDGNEHQLILKDYRFFEDYHFIYSPEDYDDIAGDALFYNTYTGCHEHYAIWLDSFDEEGNTSFYVCMPVDFDSNAEDNTEVTPADTLGIRYEYKRINEEFMFPL